MLLLRNTKNIEHFDAANTDHVEREYAKVEPIFRKFLHQAEILSEDLEPPELVAAGYVKARDRYYHSVYTPIQELDPVFLFKAGLLENLKYIDSGNPENLTLISHMIYVKDKYAKYRGVSETAYSRLDTFQAYKEYDKRNDAIRIRQQGTRAGSLLYKNLRTSAFKTENLFYLKAHQYGPEQADKDLICHVRGTVLLGRQMTNFEIGKVVPVADNQFHHILYTGSKSIYKTAEPSAYFGKMSYKDWPHDVHLEFLGCITLSGDGHDSIHNSNRKDGIDHWFKRLANKECISLPYHWTSEENYNRFLNWLDENTKHFDKGRAPSYQQFLESQHTSNLANIVSQD